MMVLYSHDFMEKSFMEKKKFIPASDAKNRKSSLFSPKKKKKNILRRIIGDF